MAGIVQFWRLVRRIVPFAEYLFAARMELNVAFQYVFYEEAYVYHSYKGRHGHDLGRTSMTRCGIGPRFSVISVLFGVLVGLLIYLYPERLMIESIPYWLLAILGTGLIVVGTMVYVNSLRKFNVGYKSGGFG